MTDPRRPSHKYTRRQVWGWLAAAVALSLSPMLLAWVGPTQAGRSAIVEFGVALGFVAIGLLAVQFVTSGRFRRIGPVFGSDVVLHFHRTAGIAAVALVVAHPIVIIAREPDYLKFFDPRVNLPRAIALAVALAASIILISTSLWRTLLRLDYERWRAAHGALAALVLIIGIVHGIQVRHHLATRWQQVLWAIGLGAALVLVAWTRLVRPWLSARRPYVITDVRSELSDVTTITLTAEGHQRMPFIAGQFAWITIGESPYSLQQHPFSFSSSEHDEQLAFTAKAVGDFTSTWPDLTTGTRAFLEGPFGGFTIDDDCPGAVLIAGGIGVTPMLSMLRTLADDGDQRPHTLIYATSRLDRAPFLREIDAVRGGLDLDVHHVLEEPPAGWEGPDGYLTEELLDRLLPADRLDRHYFICGPEPMMDVCETGLRALGVSWRQIYTERFQVV